MSIKKEIQHDVCPACLTPIEQGINLKNQIPNLTDISVCVKCTAVLKYDATDLKLKPMQYDEFKKLTAENRTSIFFVQSQLRINHPNKYHAARL